MWIVPMFLNYTNTSASFTQRAWWVDGSTRFISPYIALFTIQGLVFIRKLNRQFKGIDLFLLALVAWDLLYVVRIKHMWEVEVLYPIFLLVIFLLIIFFGLISERSKPLATKVESYIKVKRFPTFLSFIIKHGVAYTFCLIFLFVALLYSLQSYRDSSRYAYYFSETDLINFSRKFVAGWQFLDNPDENNTIALTMDWKAPGHNWFFYPLLGRWLQNDIVYISSKYKGEFPAKYHRGLLRGNNLSTWLYNAKRKKVDYILVGTPWPIELEWMLQYSDKFKLVFSDEYCKIFKHAKENI
jgi:hypothetical protein